MMITKDTTIGEVLATDEYHTEVSALMDYLSSARAFARKRKRLKAHPIDRLIQSGDFTPERFIPLFASVLNKDATGYGATARAFIRDVGIEAFNKTMAKMLKEQNENTNTQQL